MKSKSGIARGIAIACLLGTIISGLLAPATTSAAQLSDNHLEYKKPIKPLTIEQQGSFFYGGQTITASGSFDEANLFGNTGDIFTADKGYASFQIPPDRRRLPIVMWHGGGQTGVCFENSEDHEGYASIFVRRGWAVYTIDEPRRGRSGITTFSGPLGSLLGEQIGPSTTLKYGLKAAFEVFRLGNWLPGGPSYFPGSQFPQTDAALERLNAQTVQMYNEDFDQAAGGARQVPLFEKIGPAIIVTHSFSGLQGWYAAMLSSKIKAIVAYEPGSGAGSFVFPVGESRPTGTIAVPLADFMKLTRIPIQIVYGDNLPQTGGNVWQQQWRLAANTARAFAAAINRHGGNAKVTELPEIGLHGNTHFPFADLNNEQVADQMSQFLRANGLDRRD